MNRFHVLPFFLLSAGCPQPDPDCTLDGVDGPKAAVWFPDVDEDGFGDPGNPKIACEGPPTWVTNGDDCDDQTADVHPDIASDVCDGVDNDCDGMADEDGMVSWYLDADGDDWGSDETIVSCAAPSAYVATTGDCDDDDLSVHPTASEICDGKDTDCDPTTQEIITATCHPDLDGDGFGDPGSSQPTCEVSCPPASVPNDDDCNDSAEDAYPGGTEVCDGIDNDCDSATFIDEGSDCVTGTDPVLNPANGHVYLPVAVDSGWSSAGGACASRGYHLVWLEDLAEATFVHGLMSAAGGSGPLWVGLGWSRCGGVADWQRVDHRPTPDTCDFPSAWERPALDGQPTEGFVYLDGGALHSVPATPAQFLDFVCEVEP